jgi:hypothetical protein
MSRFDELTSLFDVWRTNWVEQYREHQILPLRLAKRFQEFLGCPEKFRGELLKGEPPDTMYVSPTRAKWDDQTEQFNLVAYQNSVEDDVDFKDGSDFYFGLRVFLDMGLILIPSTPFGSCFEASRETITISLYGYRDRIGSLNYTVRLTLCANICSSC